MPLIKVDEDDIVVSQLDLSQPLTLAMQAENISGESIQRVLDTLFDAITNNCD